MNGKVSVIIPIYNASSTLSRTLDSIIFQSYSNLEIILINDGSTDDSLEICKEYKKRDSRIIIIDQENSGVGAARNSGIDISKGNYICFIDADDTIDENYIYELYNLIDNHKSDFSVSNINCLSESGIFSPYNNGNRIVCQREFIKMFLNFEIGSAVWGKLFNKRTIGETRFESLSINEDFIFLWEIIKKSNSISMTSQVYYNYYLNTTGSLTKSKFTKQNMSMVTHIDKVLDDVKKKYIDLINDAKNYYGACLLHNLIIYYTYLCSNDCRELFLDELNIMLKKSENINKINNYFLITEQGIDMNKLTLDIRKKIMNRR